MRELLIAQHRFPIPPSRHLSLEDLKRYGLDSIHLKRAERYVKENKLHPILNPRISIPIIDRYYGSLSSSILLLEMIRIFRDDAKIIKSISKILDRDISRILKGSVYVSELREIDRMSRRFLRSGDMVRFVLSRLSLYALASTGSSKIYILDYRKGMNVYLPVNDDYLSRDIRKIEKKLGLEHIKIVFMYSTLNYRNIYAVPAYILPFPSLSAGILFENMFDMSYVELIGLIYHEAFHLISKRSDVDRALYYIREIYHKIPYQMFPYLSTSKYTGIQDHPQDGPEELGASLFSIIMTSRHFKLLKHLEKQLREDLSSYGFPELLNFIDSLVFKN